MPGVLIVEAFGQAAAALTAHGIDKETYENKLVFLMGIDKARFRNPVIPDCKLELNIEATDHMVEFGNIRVKHLLKEKRWLMHNGQLLVVDRK